VPELLKSLESEAQSAISNLATAIATAVNGAQSAAGAVATASTAALGAAIKASTPRNCSLGTKKFCVGFFNHTQCSKSPLNVSSIRPEAIASFVADDIQALHPLKGILVRVTPAYFQYSLGFELSFILVMGAIWLCSQLFAACFFFVHFLTNFGVCLMTLICGVVGCIFLLIPTVFLYEVQKEIRGLQPHIEVEKGVAGGYFWGASA
jgi:hypothetical protein